MNKTAMKFKLDGNGPLYRQIKRAIAEPILSGHYGPGTRLPSEHAFMDMFQTSRMTVNKALQMLAEDELVVRRRRSGTFVAPQMAEHAVMEIRDIADEIEEGGATYGYTLLEHRQAKTGKAVADKLGIRSGDASLYLKCRHLGDGHPFVVEERHINLKVVPEAAGQSFDDTPPSRWLLKHVPWTRAEHAILAVTASDEMAKLLGIPPATACLRVERTTWLGDLPVTYVILTYPGPTHRLVGGFSPGQ